MSKRDELAAVLGEHEYALNVRRGGICICGFVPDTKPETLQTQQDYHRDHIADAVLAWLAEELGGEALREAVVRTWPGVEPGSYVAQRLDAALDVVRARLVGGAE